MYSTTVQQYSARLFALIDSEPAAAQLSLSRCSTAAAGLSPGRNHSGTAKTKQFWLFSSGFGLACSRLVLVLVIMNFFVEEMTARMGSTIWKRVVEWKIVL